MKSQVTLNPSRYIVRNRLKAFTANKLMRLYKRLIIAIATDGLLALCCDLEVDEKDRVTIQRRATNEENFITESLPAMGKHFDRSLANGYISPTPQFRCCQNGIPIFLGRHFGAVFGEDGRLLDDASVESVRTIRQVCFYAYKLDLPYGDAKEQSVINGFVRTEEELRVNRLSEPRMLRDPKGRFARYGTILENPQSRLAAELVYQVFKGYQPEKLQPKHGPGVTANVPLHKKWTARLSPGCPVGSLSYLYWFNKSDTRDRTPIWSHKDLFSVPQGAVAKVLLVPKDSRGPRLISAEPAERQFLQQGIKNEMVAILESHPFTAGHVNFADQSINRELAQETSLSRKWATLDLKDASDRVTTDLVDFLFRGTRIRHDIMSVRSGVSALPKGGERVKLAKYAPMGSALCFPVLATVVWALTVTAVASCYGSLESAIKVVFVYGDDLIVPAECAQEVIKTLEMYLLKVNRDKSFIGTRFAESCGMDAFDGESVTPCRLKTLYALLTQGRSGVDKVMVTLCAHARELETNGLTAASEYYYSLVEEVLGPLPYTTDNGPILGRFTTPEDWETLQGEWLSRNGKTKRGSTNPNKGFFGYYIEPEKVNDSDTDPWAHMYRTHKMWGTGEVAKWGEFDKPRRFRLHKRWYSGLNPLKQGVWKVPEWVQELMLPPNLG